MHYNCYRRDFRHNRHSLLRLSNAQMLIDRHSISNFLEQYCRYSRYNRQTQPGRPRRTSSDAGPVGNGLLATTAHSILPVTLAMSARSGRGGVGEICGKWLDNSAA